MKVPKHIKTIYQNSNNGLLIQVLDSNNELLDLTTYDSIKGFLYGKFDKDVSIKVIEPTVDTANSIVSAAFSPQETKETFNNSGLVIEWRGVIDSDWFPLFITEIKLTNVFRNE